MTLKIQIVIVAVILIALIYIINLIRKNKLDIKYALSWIIVGVIIIIFTCFPAIMISVSKFLGIVSPINMIFFLGFCFSLLILFSLTVALSINSKRVKNLNQKMALLEKEINDLKNK